MDVDTFAAMANAAAKQATHQSDASTAWRRSMQQPAGADENPFAAVLNNAMNPTNPNSGRERLKRHAEDAPSMDDAAKELEVQLVTFMLKTMDDSSPGGGMLGKGSQGMGYFRDEFFRHTAEQMVENQGLGFAQSLKNTYETKEL
ncbi:rod-binding protein [Acanthopleuribacter pedis]|uniref:Rod-binding protein n=1 Tax=Acanthopleuribacter pedis TaxID=442870 RepID=A0A8J7U1W5_9BACT|nr:rod-binding protein [Acanthopleuribacter pedis]MBO1317099.1 rod-binding protein [Acanthopleuribacter pedis]